MLFHHCPDKIRKEFATKTLSITKLEKQVLCYLVPLCHFSRLSASLSGEIFKSKLYAVTNF